MTEVAEAAKGVMTDNANSFTDVARQVLKEIQATFKSFSDHSTRLNELAGMNVEALEALFRRIEAIEASPDLLNNSLKPIVDKFHEIADEALKRNRAQTNDLIVQGLTR